jgi:hypothetical protein
MLKRKVKKSFLEAALYRSLMTWSSLQREQRLPQQLKKSLRIKCRKKVMRMKMLK